MDCVYHGPIEPISLTINKERLAFTNSMPQFVSLYDISTLLPTIESGQLILTPNQRLASRMSAAYAHHKVQASKAKSITSPAIWSWSHWLDHCWKELLIKADPHLLTTTLLTTNQELLLWEQIVSSSSLGSALLRPTATAQQAQAAYRLLHEWQQDFSDETLQGVLSASEDSAAMLGWARAFDQRCEALNVIPAIKKVSLIIDAFNSHRLSPIGNILGVGFEALTPLQQTLLTSAGNFTLHVEPATASTVEVVACESDSEEILAAAIWAKQQLRFDQSTTVAVVIPELNKQRDTVLRIFQQVFEAEYQYPVAVEAGAMQLRLRNNLPFNISAGYPLIEAPIIAAALDALMLNHTELPIADVVKILQSPFYLFSHDERTNISKMIKRLYDLKSPTIKPAILREVAFKVTKQEDSEPWEFADKLQKMAESHRRIKDKSLSTLEWIQFIESQLHLIGWPGKRPLDSIEYQQASQWQQILSQFSGLSLVTETLSLSAALTQLRSIVASVVFQPQTADSRLQILGLLEAGGLHFDHLWLTSMSDKQWPPAPSPHPLLPYEFQRKNNMPHASAERELAYASQLSQTLINNAKNIVASYPAMIDDNPTRVSDIYSRYEQKDITSLLGKPLAHLTPMIELQRRHRESQAIEVFDSGNAPKITEEAITGGSRIFADQSACPFRSFVSHRLHVRSLPETELGLSASERGNLLHHSLELFWESLKTQERLLSLHEDQLEALLHTVIENAVNHFAEKSSKHLGNNFYHLEKQRLKKLIIGWLEVERERDSFEVIAVEERRNINFSGLNITMRIDRIDRLSDGSLLVIDYKTGKVSTLVWWGERPDEPQLPLYSLTSRHAEEASLANKEKEPGLQENIGGIAFSQVRLDKEKKMQGVGRDDLPEPKARWNNKLASTAGATDWQQLQNNWARVLSALADDFIQGKAKVNPKQAPKTCQYCDLSSVCRINYQNAESKTVTV